MAYHNPNYTVAARLVETVTATTPKTFISDTSRMTGSGVALGP
ncbi:hypothetical protein GCM10010466_10790 [Planomonospora alba]|uniref:Uncharacterized protein n=1 Tax=Planomonospora alba TaxID=161354 RepID=A0ABP6MPQ0_9ACTN